MGTEMERSCATRPVPLHAPTLLGKVGRRCVAALNKRAVNGQENLGRDAARPYPRENTNVRIASDIRKLFLHVLSRGALGRDRGLDQVVFECVADQLHVTLQPEFSHEAGVKRADGLRA
jgi:hypothetical protein